MLYSGAMFITGSYVLGDLGTHVVNFLYVVAVRRMGGC